MGDRIASIAVMAAAAAAVLAAGGVVAIASGKKKDDAGLRRKLTPLQYRVTQKKGTEPPFKNEYWDHKAAGIYVDVVSGEPLFSSRDKFKSGTGWPSFSKPLAAENIIERTDASLWMKRTELRSKGGNSHLGHVFDDGPQPAGRRYCINSASLRFIAAADLKKEGYKKYASLFAGTGTRLKSKTAKATFAGGCFWCMERPFEKLAGVFSAVSGYTGGKEKNPSYQEVSSGATGHAEAVEITYDPGKVSYAKLLEVFWMQIDPTTPDRQFADRGAQYRTGIFYHDEEQKTLALASRKKLDATGRYPSEIVTEIVPASEFYRAEEYHQDYYKKNPIRYKVYRHNSGRDRYLKKIREE